MFGWITKTEKDAFSRIGGELLADDGRAFMFGPDGPAPKTDPAAFHPEQAVYFDPDEKSERLPYAKNIRPCEETFS